MTSAMTSCSDWLNSTPAETKLEPFELSLSVRLGKSLQHGCHLEIGQNRLKKAE